MEATGKTWSMLPNEMKEEVLSKLTRNEDIVRARLVCRKWRDMVDKRCERKVVVTEDTPLSFLSTILIKDCTVSRPTEDVNICQRPDILKTLRVLGKFQANSFLRVMEEAVNLQELSLTDQALHQEYLIPEVWLGRELNGFKSITSFRMESEGIFRLGDPLAENIRRLFELELPRLKKLTLKFDVTMRVVSHHWNYNWLHGTQFLQWLARCHRLTILHADVIRHYSPELDALLNLNKRIGRSFESHLMEKVQLTSLRVRASYPELPLWQVILDAQMELQDLMVRENLGKGISWGMVEGTLNRCAGTLTCVELLRIEHLGSINLECLRNAVNLKILILHRKKGLGEDQSILDNIKMIPTANLEDLELREFHCISKDLQDLVDVMPKMKRIVLEHTGSTVGRDPCVRPLGVHGGIVEKIVNNRGIQSMWLSPVNHHVAVEEDKLERVLARYPGMEETLDNVLYFDFERDRQGLPQLAQEGHSKFWTLSKNLIVENGDYQVFFEDEAENEGDEEEEESDGDEEGNGEEEDDGEEEKSDGGEEGDVDEEENEEEVEVDESDDAEVLKKLR